jgi:dephospho-CoA kinase
MSRLILGITGHIASGKTDATAYLQDSHGAVCFRFSTMLRDILERIHIEESREHLQILSTSLRSLFGDDLMSKVIAKDVAQATDDIIIVEGIRRPSDVTYLSELPGFHLVGITADMRTRYERITARSENPDDQNKTWEAFQEEQKHESEQGISETLAMTDIIINNNGDLDSLHTQIDAIIQQFTA